MPRTRAFTWTIPEYEQYERGTGWYVIAGIVVGLLIVYSYWSQNFLFGIIVTLTAVILFLRHYYEPQDVECIIDERGITVGERIYNFNDLKYFRVAEVPNSHYILYLHKKRGWHSEFPLKLDSVDPHTVRLYLMNFLDEHGEYTHENMWESLARLLKL